LLSGHPVLIICFKAQSSLSFFVREVVLEIERSESETEFELIQMIQYLAVSTEKNAQLKEATKNDNELCAFKQIIKTGWPESKEDVPKPIHRLGTSFPFLYSTVKSNF
jgi:hypothetical protein